MLPTADPVTSADDILGIEDRKYDTVHVPEWGKTVTMRSMDGDELLTWIESLDGPTKKTAGVRALVTSIVHPDTKEQIFTTKHLEALKKKNSRAMGRLVNRFRVLNGLSEETVPHTCPNCGHVDGGKPEDALGEGSGEAR